MYESSKNFNNKPVVDFSDKTEKSDTSKISPFIGVTEIEGNKTFKEYFEGFLAIQDTTSMDSLVIGFWANDYDLSGTSDQIKMISTLIENKEKMPALKALFIGSIEQEESEISWIEITDFSTFINNDFSLEYFRARGDGNFFSDDLKSTHLKKLALETGGMSSTTIEHILRSDLPNLEHLELWIGDDEYGSTEVSNLKVLFSGAKFPKLRYLGLRNCGFADELAIAIADAPILGKLDELDLSLGSLGDKGAEALAKSELIGKLKKLTVDHHYIEDEALAKLKAAVSDLSAKDKQAEDVYDDGDVYRYIFVSE